MNPPEQLGKTDPANGDIAAKRPALLQYDASANGAAGAWLLLIPGTGGSSSSVSILYVQISDAITANTIEHVSAIGSSNTTFGGNTVGRLAVVPVAGTVGPGAYLKMYGAQPADGSIVCTMTKTSAGSTTPSSQSIVITVTASAAAGDVFSDTSNSFSVIGGDALGWSCDNNSASSGGVAGIGFKFTTP